MQKLLKDLHHL